MKLNPNVCDKQSCCSSMGLVVWNQMGIAGCEVSLQFVLLRYMELLQLGA
jgi:hypothetical protein